MNGGVMLAAAASTGFLQGKRTAAYLCTIIMCHRPAHIAPSLMLSRFWLNSELKITIAWTV
eukprot:scaffold23214_cov40-Prasinocladus_malaysianus.AAC.2